MDRASSTEDVLAAAAAATPAGAPQEGPEDPQQPPVSPAATDSETDVSARKVAAQEPHLDPRTVDEMGMGESDVDAADPPAKPSTNTATESSTPPNATGEGAAPWSVEDSLSEKPREAAANDPEVPLDDEEELSVAGDESSPSTTPVADEEPIATAHPDTNSPTQEEATGAPSPSPVPMTVEEAVTWAPATTPMPVTTKPSLRTDAAAVVSDSSTLHSRLNQGNPLLLISFAAICCGFLILWVRKRKISSSGGSSSDGGSSGSSKIASKVQYSRIENKKESPFEEDDDDDDDDRGDNWDDWEGGDMGRLSDEPHVSTNAYQTSLYAHPNPFAAPMASPPESPELMAQHTLPQFRFAAPPRLAAHDVHHQTPPAADYLSEIVVSTGVSATTSDAQKATSPGSNSSSDSYEVVTDDPNLLHTSPFTSSKKSPPKPTEDADKQTEDDLFSQFGMVPTFKKSAQPSFLQTPPTSSSGSSHRQPPAVIVAAPVSAAAASALFAAEMEDLSVAAASDEWGEDDEWVQGL